MTQGLALAEADVEAETALAALTTVNWYQGAVTASTTATTTCSTTGTYYSIASSTSANITCVNTTFGSYNGTVHTMTGGWTTTNVIGGSYTPPVPDIATERKRTRKWRASMKRTLKLMFGIGFGQQAKVFIGGGSIEVSHPDSLLKFVLTKSSWRTLASASEHPGHSTPYHLALYTKCDVHVADLCVYMEDTPVLDQVLALSMFIQSGDEMKLLETANWRNLTNDYDVREIIALEQPKLTAKLRLNNSSRGTVHGLRDITPDQFIVGTPDAVAGARFNRGAFVVDAFAVAS